MALKPAQPRNSSYQNFLKIKVINTKTGTIRGKVPTADLVPYLGHEIRSESVANTISDTLIHYTTTFERDGEAVTEPRWMRPVNFEGRLVDLKFGEGKFDSVELSLMDDDGEVHILQMKDCIDSCSGFAVDFYKRLPNMDLTKPVRLVPYAIFNGATGYLNEFLTAYQEWNITEDNPDGKIPSAFTKDSKVRVPEWEETVKKGKKSWDRTKASKFFEDLVEEYGEKIREAAPVQEEEKEMATTLDEEPPF